LRGDIYSSLRAAGFPRPSARQVGLRAPEVDRAAGGKADGRPPKRAC